MGNGRPHLLALWQDYLGAELRVWVKLSVRLRVCPQGADESGG